ncbi:hypothetical protein [Streptomyces sp. NPDC046985]|uniref:hypothetical protein n=1 Tax=Streptomyces sp. NPDC046985 TaxID=3155377 RepID=UPI0033CEA5A9
MTTYVVITLHPPQLCQTSNKVSGEMCKKLGPEMANSSKYGVTVHIGPLITSDHRSFWVMEAEDYDGLRKFVVESGLIQWNSVTTLPVIDYSTAMSEVESVTPIWNVDGDDAQ